MKNILRFRKNTDVINNDFISASVSVEVYWDGVWVLVGELFKCCKRLEAGGYPYFQWVWAFDIEIAEHLGTGGAWGEPLYVSKRKIKRQFLENLRYFGGYLNKKAKQENDDEKVSYTAP